MTQKWRRTKSSPTGRVSSWGMPWWSGTGAEPAGPVPADFCRNFSENSCELVRSVMALPALPPVLTIPMTISVTLTIDELLGNETDGSAEIQCVRVGQPFELKYVLKNTYGGPLAAYICFESSEELLLDVLKEVGPL